MIGTESDIYTLWCDECGYNVPYVFGGIQAIENHMSDNGWQKVTDSKKAIMHICPTCTIQQDNDGNGEING